MSNKEKEIILIHQVITHPAGYILNLFGNMLNIRSYSTEFGTEWEIAWEEVLDGSVIVDSFKQFRDAMEAATFFVEKRFSMQLGIDIDASLMEGELHE